MRKEIAVLFDNYGFKLEDNMSQNSFYKSIIDQYIRYKRLYTVWELQNRCGIAVPVSGSKNIWYYNTISNKNYIEKELLKKHLVEIDEDHKEFELYMDGMIKYTLDKLADNGSIVLGKDMTIYHNIRDFFKEEFEEKFEYSHTNGNMSYSIEYTCNAYIVYKVDEYGKKIIYSIYYNRNRFRDRNLVQLSEYLSK